MYLSDFNVKTIIILFVTSIVVIIAHHFGVTEIEMDLQNDENYSYVAAILDGDVEGDLSSSEGKFTTRCDVNSVVGYTNCGISIGIGPKITEGGHDISRGIDLRQYDRLEFKVSQTAPHENKRLRIAFRHFDPKFSNKYEFVSLKYNSLVYLNDTSLPELTVPLSSFMVDDWWLKRFKIGYEDAQLDFSNIVFIEFTSDNIEVAGSYSYKIETAVLHGQLVSELELIKGITVVWLIAILFLAVRQARYLDKLTKIDPLTKLLNRRGMAEAVNLDFFKEKSRTTSYLFYFDLDGFKKINDTHGHQIGDKLLIIVSDLVKSAVQKNQTRGSEAVLARIGGDEFAARLDNINDDDAILLAEEIIEKLSRPVIISGRLMKVGVSIGIVNFDQQVDDFTGLLDLADTAMYVAKKEAKNTYRLFNRDVKDLIYKRREIAGNLKQCIEQNLLSLNYMPIVSSDANLIRKVEVLLRTSHPNLENIGPDQFIPIAEDFGLIHLIDLWVVEETFKKIIDVSSDPNFSKLTFCINISSKEINNPSFIDSFSNLLSRYPVDPRNVELEITETSMIEIDTMTVSLLNQLRALGVKLALDDFGTGYSSFRHMIEYPIDCLKIDKSFIDNFELLNDADKTIISSMIAIAKANNLQTVAEGVETEAQRLFLKEANCDLLQGYLFSKPVVWERFSELVREI